MKIKMNFWVSRFLLISFMIFLFALFASSFLNHLLSYLIEKIQLGDFIMICLTLLAILLAYYTFHANQRDSHNQRLQEQTSLINGIISELNVSKDNLEWYEKEIKNNNFTSLDHLINKVHIENYLSKLNGNFFNEQGFTIISNINDKISQLNSRISEGRDLYLNFNPRQIPLHKRFNTSYCSKIAEEVLKKIDNLKKELDKQKKNIKNIMI